MNRKTAISAVIALTMATGQLAFAQGNSNRNQRGGNDEAQRGENNDRRGNEVRQPERRVAAANQHDSRGFGRAHNEERGKGRGVGPNSEYYRGDRLPADYRHRNYVVNDWRSHRLSAPPRGYQWVQSGGDYILIAVATGIIAQILLNH
jgi:Ni/Co efflux regulator RcnB